MNKQLSLDNVRHVLIRLEETIIYSLIERAQFKQDLKIYEPAAFGPVLGGRSLMDHLLYETEVSHAKVRRYTSPDEHPFSRELPEPILPALAYGENPLVPNHVNFNPRIRDMYEKRIIPMICESGDDLQYGSASVCDVACLQAISKRVHYGKFVAESKRQSRPDIFESLISRADREGIMHAITDPAVEQVVLDRVEIKAKTYTRELMESESGYRIPPEVVVQIYREFIIPLNKEVQTAYLLGEEGEK